MAAPQDTTNTSITTPTTDSTSSTPGTTKNPYNTRRKSLFFSPTSHSAVLLDPSSGTIKHPAPNPEPNPRSPKRVKRISVHLPTSSSLTPPPSPPGAAPPSASATLSGVSAFPAISPDIEYDEEDDPVINAIIHVLQLSENTPLSTRDLSSSILEWHLCSLDGPNPSSVVTSRITSHLKKRAAEKPPREPLLVRTESENGRKRTEYAIKFPELVSDRSLLYKDIPHDENATEQATKVLQRTTPKLSLAKVNLSQTSTIDGLDSFVGYDSVDDEDDGDITNRSPDRPTLFDPPSGIILDTTAIIPSTSQTYDMVDIETVATGIKLDYEFYTTATMDNLTPPSEGPSSYPTTPLRQVFSRLASPSDEASTEDVDSPVSEPDDPQSPHSGGPPPTSFTTSFYDSLLVDMEIEQPVEADAQKWFEFDWNVEDKGRISSPENVGMDELDEWLEGI